MKKSLEIYFAGIWVGLFLCLMVRYMIGDGILMYILIAVSILITMFVIELIDYHTNKR